MKLSDNFIVSRIKKDNKNEDEKGNNKKKD